MRVLFIATAAIVGTAILLLSLENQPAVKRANSLHLRTTLPAAPISNDAYFSSPAAEIRLHADPSALNIGVAEALRQAGRIAHRRQMAQSELTKLILSSAQGSATLQREKKVNILVLNLCLDLHKVASSDTITAQQKN